MKKKFILFMVGGIVLSLTGCSLDMSGKTLTCTGNDNSNSGKQEIKYIMTFNDDGSILEKVDASIRWTGDHNITANMLEESFCDYDDMVKDTCKVNESKNGDVEIMLSRKILESDEVILGDFYIEHDETYESMKIYFEDDNWNSIQWTCR